MSRILRSEFYRMFRSSVFWIALAAILAADLFLSSRTPVTTSNMYELPRLCTMGQFTSYAENSTMSVSTAKAFFKKRGQLEESDATDLMGVFQDVHPYQFRWVLASRRGLLVIPLVFAVAFLALDFDRRSFNNALYAGHSRNGVFFGKLLFLFIMGFLINLIGICALTGIFASTVYTRLPAAYVWSRLGLHALSDLALMAPPLLAVCLLRKTVIAGALIVVYDLLARFTAVLPMTGQSLEAWDQGANMTPTLLWSLGILLVCAAVSYVFFRKVRLP
jgi:ABC-type transport system involved in multi-copper enzyme maturation permease subunit